MSFVQPLVMCQNGVRLEPLSLAHEEGLRAAAADGALWNLPPQEFMAHGTDTSPPAVRRHSPVVLSAMVDDVPHHQVLVNVGQDVPPGFSRFERLIEVVSAEDAEDRTQARQRWKYYADRGYTITRHDLAAQKGA